MTTIVTRAGKGSPLTHTEVDTNFTNLNTAKLETAAIPLGTLQAPSVSFLNDSDTGIFCPQGGNSLAIATGGQYAITCTSTQAVGIKTANPQKALHVAGPTRVGADDATDAFLEIGEGATGNRTSYIDIVADTTYTDYGLRIIRNNTGANATSELKHRGTGALNFTTQEAAPIVFNTTNSPALTITSGGLVGIGNSGPSDLLHIGNSSATTRTVFRIQTGNAYSDPNGISYANALASIGARLAIDGTASGYIAQMGVGNSANLWLGSWNSGATDGSIQLVTGNNTTSTIRATLNSTGLGIGTTEMPSDTNLTVLGNFQTGFYRNVTSGNRGYFLNIGAKTSGGFADGGRITGVVESGDSTGYLSFGTRTGGTITEKAQIDSSGRLLVGTSSALGTGQVGFLTSGANQVLTMHNSNATPFGLVVKYTTATPNGTGAQFVYLEDASALRCEIRSNGGIANYSANDANLSDRNVKKDIALAAGTWDCIKEWEIVNYRYKDQPDDAELNLGVIAQQVAESCPEVITIFQEAKDATEDKPAQEERLGVKEQQMYWMAIKALQEAMGRIETLEQRLIAAGID